MINFEIDYLDHVAINVADMEKSADWYISVLGLKKYKVPKWGDFPVFLLSGKFGVALFPANLEDELLNVSSNNVKIDHFAFNVSNSNFDKAVSHYSSLNLDFEVKDHYYFQSVYTKDPDGHVVELTTLMVDESEFY